MAHWTSRLLSPNSRNEGSSSGDTGTGPTPPGRPRGPSRITEDDILENAYGIPTLPTPVRGTQSPRPTRTTSHGRSMSHPFPSLFTGKKKHSGDPTSTTGCEFTEDSTHQTSSGRNLAPSRSTKPPRVPDKDLMTGKCMTCDSMVRWPKELKVFRCTVCLTINDLKPIVLEARNGDEHRTPVSVKAGTYPGSNYQLRIAPISLEKHDERETSNPSVFLPQSRNWESKDTILDKIEPQPFLNSPSDYLPSLPIRAAGSASIKGRKEDDFNRSVPYSKSSPVTFLGTAPECKSHGLNASETDCPEEYRAMESQYMTEKDPEHPAIRKQVTGDRNLFKSLEDYIVTSLGSFECINTSFTTSKPNITPRTASEGSKRAALPHLAERSTMEDTLLSELDAKTLLLGNFAENGSWWIGSRQGLTSHEKQRTHRNTTTELVEMVTLKSPRIDWVGVDEWYHLILNSGSSWRRKLDELIHTRSSFLQSPSDKELDEIEEKISEAQAHTRRVLLKATESLLKRPGRPLSEPGHLRFLLIILANPLLYSTEVTTGYGTDTSSRPHEMSPSSLSGVEAHKREIQSPSSTPATAVRGTFGQHSGIIKRILGLLSNVSNECHHHLVSWFARYSENHFQKTTDLIGSFVTYRLGRQHGKKRVINQDPTADLVPSMSASGRTTSAALHAALGAPGQTSKKTNGKPQTVVYNDDWQIKAAARVMALLFSANNSGLTRRDSRSDTLSPILRHGNRNAGSSPFVNTPFSLAFGPRFGLWNMMLVGKWRLKREKLFFDSIMTRKNVNQYLILRVRRDCLVEDSLKGVSEVVGSGGEEIKKGLRIEFRGEEGIDAGGLRKEWFLLLVRDVFNPEHGMFTYDEDSHFCYFNPDSFETTDQFFLVGVVLGLAIYNSTILDVALPPFAFRKLLAAGPVPAPGVPSYVKLPMIYSLEDLAEYRPAVANGLKQLLEFEGDVESTFCRDFVVDVERYGQITQIPLCPDGEKKPVTNNNRREFVDLYVRYLLDTAVVRQFEPFKRGFFTVCGGNALSLFRPEEIELLIRGSDEPLDIPSLRAVSVCENWGSANALEHEPVIVWFWESFGAASPNDQRRLLSFITGSDRIPAMGTTNLVIKLSCLGDDSPRFPVARTCFNMLSLWRYSSKEKLETMLWRAVNESEGFGLK
ncbi:hypothetical protein B7494_g2518 [Chlorociboria aeruginascens]|nr:hypothetical protein B7494_g2518 [Chlorociboria aeruginascens]